MEYLTNAIAFTIWDFAQAMDELVAEFDEAIEAIGNEVQ